MSFLKSLPNNRNRSFLVHSLIKSLGLLSSANPENGQSATLRIIRPRLASVEELCLYHDKDYIDFVLNSGNETASSHQNDCPPFPGLGRYVQMVAGATLSAAEALKSGNVDVAIAWDGGRHHAQKSKAAGFCYVADCIIAILSLKRGSVLRIHPDRRKARIMYIDFDLHFSDAVSECFYKSASAGNNAQVLTLSIHYTAPGFYPAHPLSSLPDITSPNSDPFTLSLPLKQGASAKTFARIWGVVQDVKDVFKPDYVVVQCGADGLAGDPHGIWNWSVGNEKGSMQWCVGEIIEKWETKVLLLGGGGYNSANVARAWASLTSGALGRHFPPDTPIPDHIAFPLYSPSFTLDVPAGNMRDENSDDYLCEVEGVYRDIVCRLEERCQ
ncbi:histone deacetylase 8 [Fomitiporia mediterranea MF3/22]|uniref:histone deacetylase 8 n=1 Tax=Fomitiporia mediterranea (strain MF3/22) TaxID=694068 RepID=UPI0004409280|nr:histone deacetylase 8 [Fomitiporia mediterranea MF3/22]EJD08441.1 histone deacetylase 8 [Fomitiporia mediterranea MF3/22]